MRRADQILARRIEKAVGQPVQLKRDMAATVQIGLHPALMTHREGTAGPALVQQLEAPAQATVLQQVTGTERLPVGIEIGGRLHGRRP
jgi:hypothetical protein